MRVTTVSLLLALVFVLSVAAVASAACVPLGHRWV
jgi:hypothetical protein